MAGSVRVGFSKKVVGWDSGPRASSELVLSALDYALLSRDVRDGALIHHCDKGSVRHHRDRNGFEHAAVRRYQDYP